MFFMIFFMLYKSIYVGYNIFAKGLKALCKMKQRRQYGRQKGGKNETGKRTLTQTSDVPLYPV